MEQNLTINGIADTFRDALEGGWIREEDSIVMFHDLDFLKERILYLCSLFPANTLHALAIKANPLIRIMEFTKNLGPGIGVEAASIGEVRLALHCGFKPENIVYDSPVKTVAELKEAITEGITLNIDNLSELERVAGLVDGTRSSSRFGIRINPQVGTGSIAESSVAGEYSKFGVPISTKKKEILDAFRRYPWLTGIHLHVGSQGCPVELLVGGVRVINDLRQEINRQAGSMDRIQFVDIGGGVPVSYDSKKKVSRLEEYVAELNQCIPDLLSTATPRNFRLITEFGRWIFTNSGWTVSRVEYVKHDPGISTAMIHAGADLFVRECLNPKDWQHEYTVLDKSGEIKTGRSENPWNLAGPLCFSGDILAKNVTLPEIEEGDYLVIHDTGGYTFSMWSRYNSRFSPRILGYTVGTFEILRERENFNDLVSFWR